MTYPLRQRTFHEFLYYLLNVGLHCCGTRAVKHYRRQLIKEYHQRGVCNESETENPSCVKWSSLTFVRPFLPSLYLVCCLFLSDCVCQSVSLQNHTGIFQNAHVEGFFLKKTHPQNFTQHTQTRKYFSWVPQNTRVRKRDINFAEVKY